MKKIHLFVCLTLISINTYAQNNNKATGLVYGTDYAFLLTAPKGWVLDNEAGQSQRLSVVFYPKGESWDSATTAMYASTWTLKEHESINDVINADIARARKSKPGVQVTQKPNITLSNNVIARIREIPGDKNGNYETIAYISQRNFAVLIVITSRNKKDLDKKIGKFYELVKSYKLSAQKK